MMHSANGGGQLNNTESYSEKFPLLLSNLLTLTESFQFGACIP